MKGEKKCFFLKFFLKSAVMTALDSTRTAVVIMVTRLLKSSDDESCRALVNVLCRDLKDTWDSADAAVVAATVVALLANDTGNAVESNRAITGKGYPRRL